MQRNHNIAASHKINNFKQFRSFFCVARAGINKTVVMITATNHLEQWKIPLILIFYMVFCCGFEPYDSGSERSRRTVAKYREYFSATPLSPKAHTLFPSKFSLLGPLKRSAPDAAVDARRLPAEAPAVRQISLDRWQVWIEPLRRYYNAWQAQFCDAV